MDEDGWEPPDGGWGWMVVVGVAIINMSTLSLVGSFGLLFKDTLEKLQLETTGAAFILNIMTAVMNFSGLFTGPVIKKFSFRKVAIAGGVLSALGMMLTSQADSLAFIIASYSLLAGLGNGLLTPSSFVALNTYFASKRGRAVGLALAGTGLGQMLMPHTVKILLDYYAFPGTVLILGSVALHSIVGSMLFQPVEWHMRRVEDKEKDKISKSDKKSVEDDVDNPGEKEAEVRLLMEQETELKNGDVNSKRDCLIKKHTQELPGKKRSRTETSFSSSDFGSSLKLYGDVISCSVNSREPEDTQKDIPCEESSKNSFWVRIARFLDLDLFRDAIFINIVVCLALTYTAGVNFSMIFPFFLMDKGFTRSETATCMSVLSAADIVSRVVIPPITDKIQVKKRYTFLLGTTALAVTRSALVELTDHNVILAVSALCGFVRGATIVNFNLSISEHCSNEKLPAALGINMVLKGIFIISIGPLLGFIRDYTGSYPLCVHVQSLLLIISALSWTIEFLITCRRKKSDSDTR